MRAIAFNGGKESLVVLHKYYQKRDIIFRIKDDNDFPEINEYVNKCIPKDATYIEISSIKELETTGYNIEIVILGVRRSDPGCENMETYQKTDPGWPKMIRYSPLLDWSYKDVWDYIDFYNLPVCKLYEIGYTSIGNKKNTFPNYHLFNKNMLTDVCRSSIFKSFENEQCKLLEFTFQHAKFLKDESTERAGRIKAELPLCFTGKVVHGKGLAKGLGFPTANLCVVPENLSLDEGVYYGTCSILPSNTEEKMVMSIGVNPMFGDKSIEIHILKKYESDFYDQILKVNVQGFIRPMQKFKDLDELIQHINKDIEICKFYYEY